MQTFLISIVAILLAANIHAADPAPSSVTGHVIIYDQTSTVGGIGLVAFDAQYTYFSSGDPHEPYVYQKLSPSTFIITNFDPDHPQTEWSRLLFTFTSADSGTVFDEDDGQLKATFRLYPPSPPALEVVRRPPAGVVVGVKSQAGQIMVVQQSANLLAWSAVATNVSWTGRWEFSRPVPAEKMVFYRAFVPTQ